MRQDHAQALSPPCHSADCASCPTPDGGVCAPAGCFEQAGGAASCEQRAAGSATRGRGRYPADTRSAPSCGAHRPSCSGDIGGTEAHHGTERDRCTAFEPDNSRSLTRLVYTLPRSMALGQECRWRTARTPDQCTTSEHGTAIRTAHAHTRTLRLRVRAQRSLCFALNSCLWTWPSPLSS